MGAIVNSIAVIVGSLVGILIGKAIPENIEKRLMQGMGLAVLTIGISGAVKGEDTLVMILSLVVGILIGEGVDLDAKVKRFVNKIEAKYAKSGSNSKIGEAFLSSAMVFCVGSMAIVGSLESGLVGDHSTLYTKSILDGITSILFASSMGFGVALSSIPILIWQGGLTLFASYLAPILSQAVITEVVCVGSVLLIAMGLNMLELTDIKIMNMTPAMFIPIIIMQFI